MTDHKPLTEEHIRMHKEEAEFANTTIKIARLRFDLDDVRSVVQGLRADNYEVYPREAHYVCPKCKLNTAIGINQGPRRGWCRSCNEAYWFPVFVEKSTDNDNYANKGDS